MAKASAMQQLSHQAVDDKLVVRGKPGQVFVQLFKSEGDIMETLRVLGAVYITLFLADAYESPEDMA